MRLEYATETHDEHVTILGIDVPPTMRTSARNNVHIQVTQTQITSCTSSESWYHGFDATQVFQNLHISAEPRIRGMSTVHSPPTTEHPDVPREWPMSNAMVLLALAGVISGVVQMFPTRMYDVAKRGFQFMKHTNVSLTSLPMGMLMTLWMVLDAMTAVLFAQLIVHMPGATNCARMVGSKYIDASMCILTQVLPDTLSRT